MPELPEVETIRRQLAPLVEGRRWSSGGDPRPALVAPARAGGARGRARGPARGAAWAAAASTCVWHLERRRVPRPAPAHDGRGARATRTPSRRTHACASRSARRRLRAAGGRRGAQLAIVDPRRFGTGELLLGAEAMEAFFAARLGFEPFDEGFTAEHLRALARGPQRADQGVAARSAPDRGRRQHLRRRGAVPRRHPSAAPGRDG